MLSKECRRPQLAIEGSAEECRRPQLVLHAYTHTHTHTHTEEWRRPQLVLHAHHSLCVCVCVVCVCLCVCVSISMYRGVAAEGKWGKQRSCSTFKATTAKLKGTTAEIKGHCLERGSIKKHQGPLSREKKTHLNASKKQPLSSFAWRLQAC